MLVSVRYVAALVALLFAVAPVGAQQVPAVPNPVPVTLTASTTALLVLDVTDQICGQQARCNALLPKIAALLAAARRAGVTVVHSAADSRSLTAPMQQPAFLPAAAPAQGESIVIGGAQERFYGTLLDQMLRRRGITTLILAGWRVNGSLLYTAVAAGLRGYTVVVPDDATSATQDYDVAIGRYQLLTQLNGNPQNEPLRKYAVTLSRSDLIGFK